MIVVACDPGYRESALVFFDGSHIVEHVIDTNDAILDLLIQHGARATRPITLAIEQMQVFSSNYGIGQEVFDSVFWSGRFAQAWSPLPFDRIIRAKVRGHLGAMKGGDAAVRQALIARFGPYKEQAIGTKKAPGPCYGLKSHEWQALALAVTWWDTQIARPNTAPDAPSVGF